LHLRYIERDGVEKDGSKGVLYTARGAARAQDVDGQQFPGMFDHANAGKVDQSISGNRLSARNGRIPEHILRRSQ
jgi:hypothetical protein